MFKTITIFKNRTFSDETPLVRWSEPINVAGYNSAIIGLNLHSITSYSGITAMRATSYTELVFQHSPVKESDNSENWLPLDYSASPSPTRTQNGVTTYRISNFLPFIRIGYIHTFAQPTVSGILASEASVVGHLFEDYKP